VAKNSRNHSKSLGIPAQLSRRLRRFPDRPQPLMVVKGGASRQWPTRARLALTSTGDMSESESYFMLGSRDLEKRIRFESACRSLTPTDTFFTVTSRA
jgi:hypothetical protein